MCGSGEEGEVGREKREEEEGRELFSSVSNKCVYVGWEEEEKEGGGRFS